MPIPPAPRPVKDGEIRKYPSQKIEAVFGLICLTGTLVFGTYMFYLMFTGQ